MKKSFLPYFLKWYSYWRKFVLIAFAILAILYAGTKPMGRNATRVNAENVEEIVNSGQLSVDSDQWLDGNLNAILESFENQRYVRE